MKYFLIVIAMSFHFLAIAEEDVQLHSPINEATDMDVVGIKLSKQKKLVYLMRDCPVVGNTESGIYHLPNQPNYQQMLVVNKCGKKRDVKIIVAALILKMKLKIQKSWPALW